MRGVLSLTWAAAIVLVLAAAFGTARPAHAVAAGTATMSAADDDGGNGDPINGRKVFLRNNCYSCHGGRGGGGMCPSLRADKPDAGDVAEAVLNGTEDGMPSFRGFVTPQEIQDLAAYIQSLRTPAEPTFTHWWEPGIPAQ